MVELKIERLSGKSKDFDEYHQRFKYSCRAVLIGFCMEPPLSQKEFLWLSTPTKTYFEYKNVMSCTVGAVMNSLDSGRRGF